MPYITTADLKELGYKWETTLDPDLTQMCVTASELVDSYIQRVLPGKSSLEANDIVEIQAIRVTGGILKFFPKYYKVNSVASIVIMANPLTGLEVNADGIKIISSTGMVIARAILSNGEYYATVTYNAGYAPTVTTTTDPGTGVVTTTTTSTIPVGVKKATTLTAQSLLGEYFMIKNLNVSQLTQFKQGNLQFQRSSKLLNATMPTTAQLLLAEYRRVR